MKKRLTILATFVIITIMSLTGCGEEIQKERLLQEISELTQQKEDLTIEIEQLKSIDIDLKEETGTARYILTLEVKQTHVTVDLNQLMKDEMNAFKINIPVDKEYYDSVQVGDKIADELRIGSLVLYNSVGSWNIKVINKTIQ